MSHAIARAAVHRPRGARRARRALGALAAASLVAAPASAQGAPARADSVIPRDLAVALLAAGRPGALDLRVAAPAERLPAGVIPAGATVLGSMSQQTSSTTILLMSQSPRDALATLEQSLTAGGWTRPATPPGYPSMRMRERGFVPTPDLPFIPPYMYCRQGEYLMPSVGSWPEGRAVLRLQHSPRGGGSMCDAPARVEFRSPRFEADSIAPALQPPPDATVRTMGYSGGGSTFAEMRADIESRATAAGLLEHYGAQMRQAGWTTVGAAAHDSVGAQLWRKRDAEGRLWNATLLIGSRPEPNTRHALLRLERAER